MQNILIFFSIFLSMYIAFYCLFRFVDRLLILLNYKKPFSQDSQKDEICSNLLEGATFSSFGEYDRTVIVDAYETELSTAFTESSEAVSSFVENAGEIPESFSTVIEKAVGHFIEVLTSSRS